MSLKKRRWNFNPFRPMKVSMIDAAPGKETPTEPMSWKEASVLSFIVMITQTFVAFLTLYSWAQIVADPPAFYYKLLVFCGGSFFVTFCSMIGISQWVSNQNNG